MSSSRPNDQLVERASATPAGEETVSVWRGMLTLLSISATGAGMAICVQAIFVCFSSLHPLLELANHCSMHALAASLVLIPLLYYLNNRGLMVCLGVACAYLILVTKPWTLLPSSSPPVANEQAIHVLSWNMLSINKSFEEIESMVREVDPDVLVLIEVRPGIIGDLPYITSNYEYSLLRPSWGGEGIAMFSRLQGTEFDFADYDFPRQPAIIATIPAADSDSELTLVGLHTLSPLPLFRAAIRDRQIRSFNEWSQNQSGPVCVCGDFNITPWTGPFQQLLDSGFIDSRVGTGNCPSWPADLGPLGIPIDHALSKGDCRIIDRQVLKRGPGSDHRPIEFTVVF